MLACVVCCIDLSVSRTFMITARACMCVCARSDLCGTQQQIKYCTTTYIYVINYVRIKGLFIHYVIDLHVELTYISTVVFAS
uniref:Secreted protein n=1 Tax=Oryza brachyantha TaxID=4533 RepID=J3KXE8_ORYBR